MPNYVQTLLILNNILKIPEAQQNYKLKYHEKMFEKKVNWLFKYVPSKIHYLFSIYTMLVLTGVVYIYKH